MGFSFFGRSMALSKQQLMNKSLFKDLKCDTSSLLENIQITKYIALRGEIVVQCSEQELHSQ